MKESNEDTRPILFLYTPQADYVRPYFKRMMDEYHIADTPDNANYAVMISSTDVYAVSEGENFNELTEVKDCQTLEDEKHFTGLCHGAHIPPTILRCAPIVCTGMQGWPRTLAEKIYRGTFIALKDNDARRSVVHAVSLPDAARAVLGRDEVFNVTDCQDPTVNELAEALAWRMSQKRIFLLKAKLLRFLIGKKGVQEAGRSLTFSCEKLRSSGNYNPVAVTEYLKTHVYDEKSL